MQPRTAAYLRERWQLSRDSFGIARDVVGGLIGLALGAFVPEHPTKWQTVLFAVLGTIGGVIVVEVVALVWRFVWVVPKVMHDDASSTIAQLERERDQARDDARIRRRNQALADELTALRAEGLHDIRNAFENTAVDRRYGLPRFLDDFPKYRDKEAEWQLRIQDVMTRGGCTRTQISRVIDISNSEIGSAAQGSPYADEANWLIGLIEMRLRRLAEIIEFYSAV